MGKASSAKKVARASRAGGKTKGQRKNLGFPVAIVAIVVLGIGLVAFARSNNPGDGDPQLGDHWHVAFGIYVCDRWVSDLSDKGADAVGIHTHSDGLIHIHPFLAGASGRAATLSKFFDQVGMKVSDSSITLPPGDPYNERTYENGTTTCGDEDAQVQLAVWDDARTAADSEPDDVVTSGIAGRHFDTDFAAYTLAFVPEGTTIPPPPSAATITEGATVDGGSAPTGEGELTEEELRDLYGTGSDLDLGTEGTEPTEPTEPTDATDSTEPADSTEATEPADTEPSADGG